MYIWTVYRNKNSITNSVHKCFLSTWKLPHYKNNMCEFIKVVSLKRSIPYPLNFVLLTECPYSVGKLHDPTHNNQHLTNLPETKSAASAVRVKEPTSKPYSSFLRMIAPKVFHTAQPQTEMLAEASAFILFARATLKFQQRAFLEACPDKLPISQAALLTAAPLRQLIAVLLSWLFLLLWSSITCSLPIWISQC